VHEQESDTNRRLIHIEYVADDESSEASPAFPPGRSYGSQNSVRCHKGLDMIETLFSTIFGGCCRPGQCPGSLTTGIRARRKKPSSAYSCNIQTPRRGKGIVDGLAQPPQIRRLALDDEMATSELDRSGSLSFLFYQDEVNGHESQ